MATKRSRETREREDSKADGGDQSEGMFSSFKRLINNFLFPSYGAATADSTPSIPASASTPAVSAKPTSSQFSSPPHIAERSTKRRRIVSDEDEGSEEEQEMDEEVEEQPRLSQMSLAELKRRGYSLEEISKIFNSESVSAPAPATSRYPTSFATPASRPYRTEISNGAANGSRAVVPRRGTPFAPPALPRRAAPVGTYTPSLAPYPAPSPARKQHGSERWSPAGAIKAQARTPATTKTGATPRATPNTLAGRRHVSVRKTPAPSRDLIGTADTTSATAHRILATLGKIPSPLPSDRLSDARSMQKVLGKRHMDTPSRDAENGHGRRSSAKPLPIAKRQRLDEDSFISAPRKAKTALHDDYYERDHEEDEQEQDNQDSYEVEKAAHDKREHEDNKASTTSNTTFGLPKASRTDKRASLSSDSEPAISPTFVSPIVSSESIFSFKATTVVNGNKEEDGEEQSLRRKKKDQESPKASTLTGKDEPEAKDEKKEPAPFASITSFGLPPSSPSSASTSFFGMGASTSSASSDSTSTSDFGFAMPTQDGKKEKDESAAPKPDFGGFNFGKTDNASDSGFSAFTASQPSTSVAAESAAPATLGFSIPAATKKDGWECACCTESNPESATSCGVCMVPRPTPKAASKEEEKPSSTSLFGFAPLPPSEPKSESPKTEVSPVADAAVAKDKETTSPAITSPFSFSFSADTSKPKEEAKPEAKIVVAEKPKEEETKPAATDLFGGFKSDFGSSSTPSFDNTTLSLTSSTSSTSLSTLASTASAGSSAAASSMFAPSTGLQKPFMFGATDQNKVKEEPKKEPAAPAAAPFNFGFGGSTFGASAKKEEEDAMADSSEPGATAAAVAGTPFGTAFGSSSTPASSVFAFGAPTEAPSLPVAAAPSSGMFMFGGTPASAPASAPAPSLTASGSFPFGAGASSSAFSTPAASSAFAAPASSAFSAPATSSAFGVFGAPSGGSDSAFSPAASVFGSTPAPSFSAAAPFSSPFGATSAAPSAFGSGGFGADTSSLTSSGAFAFGSQPQAAAPLAFGTGFGQPSAPAASPFPGFGATSAPSGGLTSSFGAAPAAAAGGAFNIGAAPAAAPAGGRRVVRGARRRGGH